MSKQVKKIGKAFKKVAKAAWKIIKPVAIAVAAYFTAGVALSFIPATAGYAASLPGFAGGGIAGLGVGAGSTAGTGYFSLAAAKVGLGSGLASGALQGSTLMAGITGVEAAGAGAVVDFYGAGVAMQAGVKVSSVTGAQVGFQGSTAAAIGSPEALGATVAAGGAGGGAGLTGPGLSGPATKAGMSLSDKILLAKVGTDVATAAFGPTQEDLMELEAKYAQEARQGSYYGMDPEGNIAPGAPSYQLFQSGGGRQSQQSTQQAPTRQEMVGQPSTVATPQQTQPMQPSKPPQPGGGGAAGSDQTRIQQGRQMAGKLFETSVAERMPFEEEGDAGMPGLFGKGQMKQQYDVPEGIFSPSPGVRYV